MPRRQRRRIPSPNPSRAFDQTDSFIYPISGQTFHGTQRAILNLAAGNMPRQKKNKPELERQRDLRLLNPRPLAPQPTAGSLETTASSSQFEQSRQRHKKPQPWEEVKGKCILQWKGSELTLYAAIKNQKGMSAIDIKEVHARDLGCDIRRFDVKKYRYKDRNNGSGSWKAIGETKIFIKKLDGKFESMPVLVWEDNVPFDLFIHKSQASAILHPGERPGCSSTSVQETTAAILDISDTDTGQDDGIHNPATETPAPLYLNNTGPMSTNPNFMADQWPYGYPFIEQTDNIQAESAAGGQYSGGDTTGPPQLQTIANQAERGFDWTLDFPFFSEYASFDGNGVCNMEYIPGLSDAPVQQQSTGDAGLIEHLSNTGGVDDQDNSF